MKWYTKTMVSNKETKRTLESVNTYLALIDEDDSWEHLFEEVERLVKLGHSKDDVIDHFYQVTHHNIGDDESIDIERAVESLIKREYWQN